MKKFMQHTRKLLLLMLLILAMCPAWGTQAQAGQKVSIDFSTATTVPTSGLLMWFRYYSPGFTVGGTTIPTVDITYGKTICGDAVWVLSDSNATFEGQDGWSKFTVHTDISASEGSKETFYAWYPGVINSSVREFVFPLGPVSAGETINLGNTRLLFAGHIYDDLGHSSYSLPANKKITVGILYDDGTEDIIGNASAGTSSSENYISYYLGSLPEYTAVQSGSVSLRISELTTIGEQMPNISWENRSQKVSLEYYLKATGQITIGTADSEGPVLTVTGAPTTWVKSATLYATASDQSGLDAAPYSWNYRDWTSSTSQNFTTNQTVSVRARDSVGNITEKKIDINLIDTTAPTITSVVGEGSSAAWAKSRTITVMAVDTQSGLSPYGAYCFDGVNWQTSNTYTYTGTATTTVIKVRDALGNESSRTVSIYADNTAPVIASVSGDPDSWKGAACTIEVIANDADSGLAAQAYSFNGGEFQAYNTFNVSANGQIRIVVRDAAGNVTETAYSITHIDTTGPAFRMTGNATAWTNQDVTLSITDALDTGIGLHDTPYSWDGGSTWTDESARAFSSNQTVSVLVRDAIGNTSGSSIVIKYIDKAAPTVDKVLRDNTDWTTQDVTISIEASDTGGSGLACYVINGTEQLANTVVTTKNATYHIQAKDKAGNLSKVFTIEVTNVDKSIPNDFTISGNPTTWVKDKAVLTVENATDDISGLADLAYKWDNDDWTDSNSYTVTANTSSLSVSIRDKAGNTRTKSVAVTKIDTLAPTIVSSDVTGIPYTWTNMPATVTVVARDSQSGVVGYSWDGGETWSETGERTFTENGQYSILAKDAVGHLSAPYTVQISYVDTTPPQIMVMPIATSDDKKGVVVVLYGMDVGGADGSLLYCWDYDADHPENAVWTTNTQDMLLVGHTYHLACKDPVGNIGTKTVTQQAISGGGSGGGSGISPMFVGEEISVEGYIFGPSKFIDDDGNVHDYQTVSIVDSSVTGLPVQVSVKSRCAGFVSGYAKLDGKKYPIYWNLGAGITSVQSESTLTGTFIIDPANFTVSRKSSTLTVFLNEYADEGLTEKVNEDKVSAHVSIDRTAPVANITYNPVDNKVTVSSRDLSGIGEVLYKTPSSTDWEPYTGPFNLSENGVILLKASDRVGNTTSSDIESIYIERPGTSDPVTGDQATYRTHWFNYYLHGTDA